MTKRFKKHKTAFAELAGAINTILYWGYRVDDGGKLAMKAAKLYMDANLHDFNKTAQLNAKKAVEYITRKK